MIFCTQLENSTLDQNSKKNKIYMSTNFIRGTFLKQNITNLRQYNYVIT